MGDTQFKTIAVLRCSKCSKCFLTLGGGAERHKSRCKFIPPVLDGQMTIEEVEVGYGYENGEPEWCENCKTKPITRPFQSWGYVHEHNTQEVHNT